MILSVRRMRVATALPELHCAPLRLDRGIERCLSFRGVRHVELRESLSWRLAEAPSERIDRLLGRDVAEDLGDLAGAIRNVAPYLAKAAPGALKGAATGFMVGGPVGAVAGGVGGGLAGIAGAGPAAPTSAAQAAVPQPGGPAGVAPAVVAQPGAAQATAPQPGSAIANPAALQLLLTLFRPEVVEALIAMVLGRNGAPGVEVAGRAVPVGAVTNLIQSLSEAASASHHASVRSSGTPRYLSEALRRGEDVAAPGVRSAALLELIHDAWDDDIAAASEAPDEDLDEEFDDSLDGADFYPGGLTS